MHRGWHWGFAAGVIIAVAAVSGRADAGDCLRWNTNLSDCEILPNNCSQTLSFGQQVYVKARQNAKTPENACAYWRQYAQAHQPAGGVGITLQSPDQVKCSVDDNGNGEADDVTYTELYRLPIAKESCCSQIPNGPYKALQPPGPYLKVVHPITLAPLGVFAIPPAEGAEFGGTDYNFNGTAYKNQKTRAKDWNRSRWIFGGFPLASGTYRSDMFLYSSLSGRENINCPDGVLSGSGECQPQVDHLIPRLDINSCECGPNSMANALVISKKLNGKMSNNCSDEDRVAILQKWTLPPPPAMLAFSTRAPVVPQLAMCRVPRRSQNVWERAASTSTSLTEWSTTSLELY